MACEEPLVDVDHVACRMSSSLCIMLLIHLVINYWYRVSYYHLNFFMSLSRTFETLGLQAL